ncbi:type VII secretion protein EccE [Gordonia hydrophobica]|uniref:Type VII secretion protein EccE n=1 Tax=Gordonia hydrophobica TaxID=40516 RepID=A0ABZ2U2M2_9ACTN|nr:type VII secretion protein EccE [Gordonia hydrophobica]MBM7366907.1 type VII secretion protein EccE [Gordonia hydrophobica]
MSRRDSAWHPTAPFDVPAGEEYIGLQRDGDTLIGVLAVTPTAPAPIVVGAAASGDAQLLNAVAAALTHHDAAPVAIDVVSHTMGCWGATPAARSYRGLLGGLHIASHRSVHLVVRLRPAAFPAAVNARGGPGAGTLRTALWCLRRVRSRLSDAAVGTRPLTAAEITELTARLTEGIDVRSLQTPGSSLVSYALPAPTPESLAALLAAPISADALSTTVTVSIAAGPSMRVTVRDNGGRAVDRTGELGLMRLEAPPAAAIGLPVGLPPLRRRSPRIDAMVPRVGPAETLPLLTLPIPIAGDGQLVGADRSGRPVTLRLAGRDIPRCNVLGDRAVAQQVVVRLAALGFAVDVASDDAQPWQRLADSVGVGLGSGGAPQRPVQVVVDDSDAGGVTAPPGATLIRIHRIDDPPSDTGPALRRGPDETILAEGAGRTVSIRPVSTDAERALIET